MFIGWKHILQIPLGDAPSEDYFSMDSVAMEANDVDIVSFHFVLHKQSFKSQKIIPGMRIWMECLKKN